MTNLTNNEVLKPNDDRRSLIQRLRDKKNTPALLLDTSGSMEEALANTDKRRIDKLREEVEGLSTNRYSFNSSIRKLNPNEEIPEPSGSTDMALAFSLIKNEGTTRVILVTDGQPDSASEALRCARGLTIDIIYVGDGEIPEFLKQLAAQSGRMASKVDLSMPKELANKITALLPEASSGTFNL